MRVVLTQDLSYYSCALPAPYTIAYIWHSEVLGALFAFEIHNLWPVT